jgi:hypothetical protein
VGLLNGITEFRVRAMANVLEAAHPGAKPWNILDDLGRIGKDARPVVIQGGLSTDAYLYDPFKRMLLERGFDVTATHLQLHGYASIQRDAASLSKAVNAASARSIAGGGDGLVNVVAHSKGGLASRWYLQQMDGIDHVAQLVTIGTPHNGSAPGGATLTALTSRLPGIAGVKELSTTSRTVTTLNDTLPQFMQRARAARPDFRIVSVTGDMNLPGLRGTDGLVSVGAARLDDSIPGLHNLVFQGAGGHHGAVAGQLGLFEPTLRSATELLAGSSVSQAAKGASNLVA